MSIESGMEDTATIESGMCQGRPATADKGAATIAKESRMCQAQVS